MTLGDKLRQIRINRNKTQAEVAEFMDISRTYYAQWENDERNINAHQLIKLSNYFHVTLDYFSDKKEDDIMFTLMNQLSNFFESQGITSEDKDKAYQDIMRVYLRSKDTNTDKEVVLAKDKKQ